MWFRYIMRYQHSFQNVIPLLKAGYSRVTHPSATKLNQIHSEEIFQNSSVRLACVRHAASVRPEPGSNSLKFVFQQPFDCSNQFQSFNRSLTNMSLTISVIYDAFQCTSHCNSLSFPQSHYGFLYYFLVVQFSRSYVHFAQEKLDSLFCFKRICCFLRGTFSIIYLFPEKSTPFFKKIQFFQKKFQPCGFANKFLCFITTYCGCLKYTFLQFSKSYCIFPFYNIKQKYKLIFRRKIYD